MIPILRDAAHRFFGWAHEVTSSGGSSGLSGSDFARVEARGASWCLRMWPEDFPEQRLRFVHRTLLHSRENGFAGAPELATRDGVGETILGLDGRLFDAQEWLNGEPLSGSPVWDEPMPNTVQPLPRQTLASLAAAVARFHRSTASLAPESEEEKSTLSTCLAEVSEDVEARREALLPGVPHQDDERSLTLRWLELLPEAVAIAGETLREYSTAAHDISTLCHGDLWAPHVYFSGTDFTGFTDFESIFFSSQASDLAHLILHFDGWTSRDSVLDAYENVLPLAEEDRAMLPAAAVVNLAWEACWSLGVLHNDERPLSLAAREAHTGNLRELLGSLELIVTEMRKERSSA